MAIRTVAFSVLVSRLLLGQIPLVSLAEQYDMTSISGSTLTDLSGNGRNGTLNSVSVVASGVTCNGTTSWVNIPAVVGNSDFTVLVFASTNDSGGGAVWEETNGSSAQVRLASSGTGYIRDQSSNGAVLGYSPSNYTGYNSWHLYYLMREAGQALMGVWDKSMTVSASMGTSASVATTQGGLCARNLGGSRDVFWAGTIGYVLVYTRAISPTEIAAAYTTVGTTLLTRGSSVSLPAVPPINTGGNIVRQGTAIAASGTPVSSVLYRSSGCQVLSSPCFGMWYGAYNYAESPTGIGPWSIYSGNPVISTNYNSASVRQVGNTLYMVAANGNTKAFDTLSSPASSGVAWSVITAGAMAVAGTGTFDHVTIDNPDLFVEGGTLYVPYEGTGDIGAGSQCGLATSTDNLVTLTRANGGLPISGRDSRIGCAGAHVEKSGAYYYLFHHGGTSSDLYLRRSSSATGIFDFTTSAPTPILQRQTYDEELTGTNGQISDPWVLENGGNTYLYYGACPNAGGYVCHNKVAIIKATLAQWMEAVGTFVSLTGGMTPNVP